MDEETDGEGIEGKAEEANYDVVFKCVRELDKIGNSYVCTVRRQGCLWKVLSW